jgi:hypothetical protein
LQAASGDRFLYDASEDRFTDTEGRLVTTEEMLKYVYDAHCRTLRASFVWQWNTETLIRSVAQQTVWKSQEGALWLLLRGYDIELTKGIQHLGPFHRFRRSDFRRVTEPAGQQSFFGFNSSRKSLFTNMIVLAAASVFLYHYWPRGGLLSAVYHNEALTTAALLFGFLLADVAGPAILVRVICYFSYLRPLVMFLPRRVNP